MTERARALAAALAACGAVAGCALPRGGVPPERPPVPPAERERAELEACERGALPPWLDDRALDEAARADRWDAQALDLQGSYLERSGEHLPPHRASDRAASSKAVEILRQRDELRARCEAMKLGRALHLPPPPRAPSAKP